MSRTGFHPAVWNWFTRQFAAPTEPQLRAWPSIQKRQHTLIAAPTGSGKTLAAFLSAIDDLVRQGIKGALEDQTQVLYVSPLKALSNDIQRNLQSPLDGIQKELHAMGLAEIEIRVWVRTGDTPARERTAMTRRPPHIVVTTPESFYILLTSEGGRKMLRTVRTLIVDEIHALVGNKRGSHLALSSERLQALVGDKLVRIGLSATQRPIEAVARFLVGSMGLAGGGIPNCTIVDSGHVRNLDLQIEIPRSPLEAVMSGEVWDEVYDRLAQLIQEHRTTLIFVNTRRLAERVARHLGERIGDENVTAHHGSLARPQRLLAEQRLKSGGLRALVATASLELGIDIGAVDLVCQVGSTRSIAALLQRIGRSGHSIDGFPKGKIFPLSRDELVECAALLDCIHRGELDCLAIPNQPLDVLAQQLVAAVACEEWNEDALFDLVRQAYPYRHLSRGDFDAVVRMLSEGYSTRRGRRSAYLHYDGVNGRLRARRGARLAAITSGGTIPENADYDVILEPSGTLVGTINEDFAIESMSGDIFQLGSASWRILRVEAGRVRVEDARGQPPSIPFWLGEAPSRTAELSVAVSRLRTAVEERILQETSENSASNWLVEQVGIPPGAARQIVEYLSAAQSAFGVMPTQQTLVMERFFDESGGMQLVIHSPFGSRLNRAWGLALRKRFCRKFNFELQAAATEDAIVLSLGHSHSFPLEEVFAYVRSSSVRDLLVQALLDAPMFAVRWRWDLTTALGILRWNGGKKVPPQLQRMNAEDLLAAVFPDQLACAENLTGEREIPDHPLVQQAIRDCLEEAMDVHGLEFLLASMERGEKRFVARDLVEPSPLASEILNARPYAFLDDAPLEERRTQAVFTRRWLDPETAADLGTLDQAAIRRVREEAWPKVENADELHDALMQLAFLTAEEGKSGNFLGPSEPVQVNGLPSERKGSLWEDFAEQLISERRATQLQVCPDGPVLWVAAERLHQLLSIFPQALLLPPISGGLIDREAGPSVEVDINVSARRNIDFSARRVEDALVEILRGRLEGIGPTTASELAASAGLPVSAVEIALSRLEADGFVLRGHFTSGREEVEWCVRNLLARIHRHTLERLRREIEPVSTADFVRFLITWQRVAPDQRVEGAESLAGLLEQLEGFEAPAAAWEAEILPARLVQYEPTWLDNFCLSGRMLWARLSPPHLGPQNGKSSGPIRSTPIAILQRKSFPIWSELFGSSNSGEAQLSLAAGALYDQLVNHGASFFADLVEETGLLRTQVEDGLGELVFLGLVTADSFMGLRALLTPSRKRPPVSGGKRKGLVAGFGMEDAGRWSRLHAGWDHGEVDSRVNDRPVQRQTSELQDARLAETVGRVLLRRYGVVFRRLADREGLPLPWRELMRVYRRLEARGEIRGGRFVAGFSGEQFALPEAVGTLRSIRRSAHSGSLVSVSAADPLNLVGILTPGSRVPPVPANRILFRDGVPIAIREAGQVRFLMEFDPATAWEMRNALVRRNVPRELRAYLGQPA